MSTLESLNNHLKVLTERHRDLDKKVAEDYANRLNSEEYNKGKLEKLNLKQEIEALKQIITLKEQQDILVHNSEKKSGNKQTN